MPMKITTMILIHSSCQICVVVICWFHDEHNIWKWMELVDLNNNHNWTLTLMYIVLYFSLVGTGHFRPCWQKHKLKKLCYRGPLWFLLGITLSGTTFSVLWSHLYKVLGILWAGYSAFKMKIVIFESGHLFKMQIFIQLLFQSIITIKIITKM